MNGAIFGDLQAFLDSGQALHAGRYDSLYPYPLVIVFFFISWIPLEWAAALVLGASLAGLVALTGRRALVWILYLPILETFALGQLSIFWLWCWRKATPWSLALLTLKPQLAIFALPYLLTHREVRRAWLEWCALIYIPISITRPLWVLEWAQRIIGGGDGRISAGTGASLWAVDWVIPLMLVCVILASRRGGLAWALNPALRPYDFTLLTGRGGLVLIPLSWLAGLGMNAMSAAWPMALLCLYAGARDYGRIEVARSTLDP